MVEICSWMLPAHPGRPPGNTALCINDGSLIGLIPSPHKGSKPGPPGRTGITWQRVPGRQPDGLLQEGELGVVEPEGLIHHVGTGLHLHPQQRDGLPPAHTESNLPREKQLSSRQGNTSEGSAPKLRSSPHPEFPLLPTWMCFPPGCASSAGLQAARRWWLHRPRCSAPPAPAGHRAVCTAQNGGKSSRLARWLALQRGGGILPSLCSLDTQWF